MNPLVIKIGVCVVASAAAFIFFLWKNGRNNPSSYSRPIDNFDASNISICCICLNEFLAIKDENKIVSLPCKHKFHQECIRLVFNNEAKYRRNCPLCRSLVSEMFISKTGLSE